MNFRTPESNWLRLSSLFLESKYDETAPYTLSDADKTYKGKVYPSLYKLYIQMADITEYNFANTYLESYQHWDALCGEEFFKPVVARWRKELELKVKSGALLEIIAQSASDDPRKRLEAAKYLYEKVGIAGNKSTRGRPSKDEVTKEAKKMATEQKIIDKHWEELVGKTLEAKH